MQRTCTVEEGQSVWGQKCLSTVSTTVNLSFFITDYKAPHQQVGAGVELYS